MAKEDQVQFYNEPVERSLGFAAIVRAGDTLHLAGIISTDEQMQVIAPGDMAGQTRAALENMKRALDSVGATFDDIVSANRFVTDLGDQDSMNKVWAEYFGDNKPTTTTVQVVKLATDPRCQIEVNAVAIID